MNRLRKLALGAFFVASLYAHPGAASATCGSLPYVFQNTAGTNSLVDANTTNANNSFLLTCATTIDNTQVGANGFYASQIVPLTVGEATFGGTQTYTFPAGVNAVSFTSQGNFNSQDGVFAATVPTYNNGIAQLCPATGSLAPACLNVRNNGDTYILGRYFGEGDFVAASGSPARLCAGNSCATAITVATSGNGSIAGAWSATSLAISGNGTFGTGVSSEGGPSLGYGYVPPFYNSAGNGVPNTMHGVLGTVACTASGPTCLSTVNLAAADAFTTVGTYHCGANYFGTNSAQTGIVINAASTTQFQIVIEGGAVNGTTYSIAYSCEGY